MMSDIADRIAGKWRIVEAAAWDKQHLDLCGPAFIEIDAHGRGDMAFGALMASLDCGFTPSGIDFEWNGADEGDQVSGDGWADLRDGGCLEGEIAYGMATKLPSSPNRGAVFSGLLVRAGPMDRLTSARRVVVSGSAPADG